MDNEVNAAFETIPEDVFEQLMGDAPPGNQPNATTVQGGTKPADPKTDPKSDPKTDPKDADPKEDPKEVVTKSPEELSKEIDEASDAEPGETDEDAPASQGDINIAEFFKAKAMGLIERGIWQEFNGMEDFEWTEENYGRLAETQANWKAEEMYENRVAKVGDVGKIILDHVENGGDPNEIIGLFKAQKRIETFDISTPQGKEDLVKEYYTKVVGWSEAKTSKYVKSLVDAGGEALTEEATDAKGSMDKGIEAQIKQTQEAAKEQKRVTAENARAWETNIRKTITGREDLTDKDKRDVEEALLNYNIKLQDGRQVNKFMVKFMELQADPQKYIDLVRFVTDPEKFMKKVEKKADTTAAKKNWDFIKGNQAVSRNTGTSHTKQQDRSKKDLVIDYRKLI